MKALSQIRRIPTILLVALCVWLSPAVAQDEQAYLFEIVVFERPGGGSEFWPSEAGQPDRALAKTALGSRGRVPVEKRELGPAVFSLKRRGMVVHEHVAWEEVPGNRNAPTWQWLDAGRLNGLIRVTRGRFLHLDTDLILRDTNASKPVRIRLNRRMRSGELHYVDHPKLGILFQATRVEDVVPPVPTNPAAGEPLPTAPSAPAASG
jgi:hypothetical protein